MDSPEHKRMPRTALLIINMQVHFTHMTHRALPHILDLADFFRASHDLSPIFITQYGHALIEFAPPVRNQHILSKSDHRITVGSEDWELVGRIARLVDGEEAKLFATNTYNAFENTTLEADLRDRGVERVVITGAMTELSETTARVAFCKGFETWVVGDATGSANMLQHDRGLLGFRRGFGKVMLTEDVIEQLTKEEAEYTA